MTDIFSPDSVDGMSYLARRGVTTETGREVRLDVLEALQACLLPDQDGRILLRVSRTPR